MSKKDIYTPCFKLKNGFRVWFRQPEVKIFVSDDKGHFRDPTDAEVIEITDHVRGIINAKTGSTGIK